MLIRRGQYRLAVTMASKLMVEQPDNPDLYAALGIAWAKNTFYADALGAFALSMGSSYYEEQGIEAHADALRAVVATAMGCAAGSTARTRREPRRMRSASRCFIVLSKICESDFTYYTDTATERRHARIECLPWPLTHTPTSHLLPSRLRRAS